MTARYQVQIQKHILQFKFDARTSRGAIKEKPTYFLKIKDRKTGIEGIGECSPLPSLSIDWSNNYEEKLAYFGKQLESLDWADSFLALPELQYFPSILFGFEIALLDIQMGGKQILFDTPFSTQEQGIPINGLVWMGDKDFMLNQLKIKVEQGFNCIKIKVGAIDFEQECDILRYIRKQFSPKEITIRVDANGAFQPNEALDKMRELAQFAVHSIEQPIKAGQWEEMYQLCRKTPLPIALDEELIGILENSEKGKLLDTIQPHFIILKPSLLGGFKTSETWIDLAEKRDIQWWMTSALESNIGLNAISQFTSKYNIQLPQGLGTGQLYHNNINSPLQIENGFIYYSKGNIWDLF